MKITRVEVRDFKGIKVVEIIPKATTTVVGGKNRQGKSSFIDAIAAAAGGKKLCPEHPIRRGRETARVAVEVDGDAASMLPPCTIVRDWWKKKDGTIETKLEIVTKEGYRAPTPQAILDRIVGNVGFDPESFLRMSAKEQAETLRQLVGLDTSALDVAYAEVYANRKVTNAAVVKLKIDYERMPFHPDAPSGEISAAELISELQNRRDHNEETGNASRHVQEMGSSLEVSRIAVAQQSKLVEAVSMRLEFEKKKLEDVESRASKAADDLEVAKAAFALLHYMDTHEIERQISESDVVNRKVRENQKKEAAKVALEVEREKSSRQTAYLKEIEETKAKLQSDAHWPVPGLGFSADGGVTYNDLPFDQVSASEQRRVAVGIRVAENPILKFFYLHDGSLLDEEGKCDIARLAAEHGCQCFLEVVGDSEGTSIVFCDGAISWAEQGLLPLEKVEPLPEEPTN